MKGNQQPRLKENVMKANFENYYVDKICYNIKHSKKPIWVYL